jgi:hypothetical protein
MCLVNGYLLEELLNPFFGSQHQLCEIWNIAVKLTFDMYGGT